jgi:hypothetical protein
MYFEQVIRDRFLQCLIEIQLRYITTSALLIGLKLAPLNNLNHHLDRPRDILVIQIAGFNPPTIRLLHPGPAVFPANLSFVGLDVRFVADDEDCDPFDALEVS